MRTLQIWLSDYMPETIKGYVQSVADNTNGDYYFIGNKANAPERAIVLDPVSEINAAMSFLGNTAWWNQYCTHPMFVADMLRVTWAMRYSDLLYADCDCRFISPPVFEDLLMPHVAWYKGSFDFFLLYSGDIAWWKQFVQLAITKNGLFDFALLKTMQEIYHIKLMRQPIAFSSDFYKHYGLHGNSEDL